MINPMRRFLPLGLLAIAMTACAAAKPLHGTVFAPPQAAKRFPLTDQSGALYMLAQARPQVTALYFGFTHCKDVCPQTLAKLARARAAAGLTPQQLQLVMVSVDPRRDTRAALRGFFAKLGVQALGLSGSPASLRPVYRAYGVAVEPNARDIGHSDYIYMLDRQGRLRELLAPATAIDDIAADMKTLVE